MRRERQLGILRVNRITEHYTHAWKWFSGVWHLSQNKWLLLVEGRASVSQTSFTVVQHWEVETEGRDFKPIWATYTLSQKVIKDFLYVNYNSPSLWCTIKKFYFFSCSVRDKIQDLMLGKWAVSPVLSRVSLSRSACWSFVCIWPKQAQPKHPYLSMIHNIFTEMRSNVVFFYGTGDILA